MNADWRKLLVPIDFSDESRDALRAALKLMTTPEHRLAVMHVVEPEPWMVRHNEVLMLLQRPTGQLKVEAHERLWRWLIIENAPEDQVDVVVAVGDPACETVRRATVTRADVILVPRKGKRRRRNPFARSFLADVQQSAPCAVLAVCAGTGVLERNHERDTRCSMPAFGRVGNPNAYS
jgi:nucleotide-binding universal stress UspA family protein